MLSQLLPSWDEMVDIQTQHWTWQAGVLAFLNRICLQGQCNCVHQNVLLFFAEC